MKKTIKWISSFLIFLLCFGILFTNIAERLRRKTAGEVDMVNSFYRLEENSLDVLMLGSSHLYYGVQPNILWGEHGITAYAMGSPQQTIATSYLLLKEALKYQKPKVLLLESYYFWYDGLYNEESRLRQAFDAVRYGDVKTEMIETFLPELTFKDKLSYYLPFMKYHSRWSELKAQDFHTKAYLQGCLLDYGVIENTDPGLDIDPVSIPEVNLEYFEKIVDLCEENAIQLVVFATPYGVDEKWERYETRQGITLTLERYLEEREIPFLFYQKTGEAGINFDEDFRDETHLNAIGAGKITRCLGSYLTSHYDMEDHRGDAEYQLWEEDYALYMKDVEKKTESGGTEG